MCIKNIGMVGGTPGLWDVALSFERVMVLHDHDLALDSGPWSSRSEVCPFYTRYDSRRRAIEDTCGGVGSPQGLQVLSNNSVKRVGNRGRP